jgi:hypothetical protein
MNLKPTALEWWKPSRKAFTSLEALTLVSSCEALRLHPRFGVRHRTRTSLRSDLLIPSPALPTLSRWRRGTAVRSWRGGYSLPLPPLALFKKGCRLQNALVFAQGCRTMQPPLATTPTSHKPKKEGGGSSGQTHRRLRSLPLRGCSPHPGFNPRREMGMGRALPLDVFRAE